ncbi:MAG: hypothetical protein H6651_16850 [Ardenticatenales bacterium]|nr:hypothetical protein [Ardenticatenales bacterium]
MRWIDKWVDWLANRPVLLWRLAALALFTGLTLYVTWRASLVVDGVRYFWLDDDQMISMRYARNLAHGHGLVWNPGERVEGYSNLLWTLLMALVHWLPLPANLIALPIKFLAWLSGCGLILAAEQLLRRFWPRPGLAQPALLFALAAHVDLVYWAANGFETPLLALLFVVVLVRLLDEAGHGPRPFTYALLALIPLVRSDALHVWGAAALVALGLAPDWQRRRQVATWLGLALLPVMGHFVWRYSYYGAWLPNTYYLKVAGIPDLPRLGLAYLGRNLAFNWVPAGLALVSLLWFRERRHWLLAVAFGVGGLYILRVGGDTFRFGRFLAHLLPLLLVLAILPAQQLRGRWQQLLFLALFGLGAAGPSLYRRDYVSFNGSPLLTIPTALRIRAHTAPEASVAVLAAGMVPYFSERPAIDLLGKSDPYVARLAPAPRWEGPSWLGHNKFDIDHSLALAPDIVVTQLPDEWVRDDEWIAEQLAATGRWWAVALISDDTFIDHYRPNPVPLDFFLTYGGVYIRDDSPEMANRLTWQPYQPQ